eukprot:6534191-Alexandrium_andersonii.AAC.1
MPATGWPGSQTASPRAQAEKGWSRVAAPLNPTPASRPKKASGSSAWRATIPAHSSSTAQT